MNDAALTDRRVSGRSGQLFAVALVTTLFFAWGFVTVFVDMLIPRLKSLFDLDYTRTMMIQFGFFAAYLVVSFPAAFLVKRVGYRKGIVIGLIVMALGAAMFFPASEIRVFALFIMALFVLASGITILQVAANPLMALLGPEESASSRLTLAQAFNSLGTTLAPMAGAMLILNIDVLTSEEAAALSPTDLAAYQDASAQSVQMPFVGIALFLVSVALVFLLVRLRADQTQTAASHAPDQAGHYPSIFASQPLVFGIIAIFLYVGAEVAIGSFLVNYFMQDSVAGLTSEGAARLVTFYWGGAMAGRFIGALVMRIAPVRRVLGFASLMAMVLVATTIALGGSISVWTILAVGFFNSIHFPTIFSLAIERLGPRVPIASGLLCMAIFGGAIIPLMTGLLADATSIQMAFVIPFACYAYLLWYGLLGSKHRAFDTSDIDAPLLGPH